MRRYNTVSRIFLILSAVNYTFARLAQSSVESWAMHEARADLVRVAEDTMEVSEKGRTPSEERSEMQSTAGILHRRNEVAEPGPEADSDALALALPSKANPKADKFFSKELDEKIREYYVMASVLAVSTGIARGSQNQISAAVDSQSTTVGRDLHNCVFGVSKTLNDHPLARNQEELVSHYLLSFRDEDLRFLRTLSRRLLEGLD